MAVPHLNALDSVVLNYRNESLDVTMNKLLDWDGGDMWAQFLCIACISILTKTTHVFDCLAGWNHNSFFVSFIWRVSFKTLKVCEGPVAQWGYCGVTAATAM